MRISATAITKLNRKDWGLLWNQALESGGVPAGDAVTINIDIEATRNPSLAPITSATG